MGQRDIALFIGLAVVAVSLVATVTEAAGKDVALAVAIAAIVAHIATYVWTTVLSVRAYGADDAHERLRRAVRARVALMLTMPLIVIAAHPWGVVVSGALAIVLIFLTQAVFLHVMIIAGFILRRRTGAAPPR